MVRGINPAYLDPYSKKLHDTANGLWVFLIMPNVFFLLHSSAHQGSPQQMIFLHLILSLASSSDTSTICMSSFTISINLVCNLPFSFLLSQCHYQSQSLHLKLFQPPYYLPFSVAASKRAYPHSSSFVFTQQQHKKSHSQ